MKIEERKDKAIVIEGLRFYPSVKIDSVFLSHGKWYFEVKILKRPEVSSAGLEIESLLP